MSLLKRVAKDVENLTLRVAVLENHIKSAKKAGPVKQAVKKTAVKKTARKKVARKVS
ncbi:MAG: hypothetical protein GY861_19185 [bacterium]|nr:hypothetical protein [bacterium]